MKLSSLLLLAAASAVPVAWADSPVDGTWNLNASKSHLTGETLSMADAGNGTLKLTNSDESYTFKPDGSQFVTPLGVERTFKKVSDTEYDFTNARHGTTLTTGTWKVSADGKALTVDSKGTKPNGDTFVNATVFARVGTGTGVIGDWKSTKVKMSAPNALTFRTEGDDVTVTLAAIKATCAAKWDGKDYPATGPTLADGITLSLTKTGERTFKFVEKINGKAVDIARFSVSADGKTLTEKGTDGQGKEPFTEVWEKA
jgi:hypothetical protein